MVFFSILVMSYLMWSAALDSSIVFIITYSSTSIAYNRPTY